ncbi:hypothetical protein NIASO_18225 [Niabella soli DSM 19437]|uniref:Uncharacterized protein n=1 Tax=Niabella soli DSM 19437 TaxID=929713 RepID=W0F4I3_9BACT|nr:hypothetical protein NIASO_18225 [Niabella soli DSM 19437]
MATLSKHRNFESLKSKIKPVKNKKLIMEFEAFMNKLNNTFLVKRKIC